MKNNDKNRVFERKSTKTGDEILIYVVLLAISIINLTGLTLYIKRK